MKTKAQKKEQFEKGKELLAASSSLVFADFGSLTAEQTRKLRRDLKAAEAEMHVLKKRILSLVFKDKGMGGEANAKAGKGISFKEYKVPVAAVFSKAGLEGVSGAVYRFFKELKLEKEKILGGYEAAGDRFVPASEVMFLGTLPSREVLLGQLVGMIAFPLRSFMFVLQEKAKKSN